MELIVEEIKFFCVTHNINTINMLVYSSSRRGCRTNKFLLCDFAPFNTAVKRGVLKTQNYLEFDKLQRRTPRLGLDYLNKILLLDI